MNFGEAFTEAKKQRKVCFLFDTAMRCGIGMDFGFTDNGIPRKITISSEGKIEHHCIPIDYRAFLESIYLFDNRWEVVHRTYMTEFASDIELAIIKAEIAELEKAKATIVANSLSQSTNEIKQDVSQIPHSGPTRFIVGAYEPYKVNKVSYFHEPSALLTGDIKFATLYDNPHTAERFIVWLKKNFSYPEEIKFTVIPVKITFVGSEDNLQKREDGGIELNADVYYPEKLRT